MQFEVATTPLLIFLTASVAILAIAVLGYTSVSESDSRVLSVAFSSIAIIACTAILGVGYHQGKITTAKPSVQYGSTSTSGRSRSSRGRSRSTAARSTGSTAAVARPTG